MILAAAGGGDTGARALPQPLQQPTLTAEASCERLRTTPNLTITFASLKSAANNVPEHIDTYRGKRSLTLSIDSVGAVTGALAGATVEVRLTGGAPQALAYSEGCPRRIWESRKPDPAAMTCNLVSRCTGHVSPALRRPRRDPIRRLPR